MLRAVVGLLVAFGAASANAQVKPVLGQHASQGVFPYKADAKVKANNIKSVQVAFDDGTEFKGTPRVALTVRSNNMDAVTSDCCARIFTATTHSITTNGFVANLFQLPFCADAQLECVWGTVLIYWYAWDTLLDSNRHIQGSIPMKTSAGPTQVLTHSFTEAEQQKLEGMDVQLFSTINTDDVSFPLMPIVTTIKVNEEQDQMRVDARGAACVYVWWGVGGRMFAREVR